MRTVKERTKFLRFRKNIVDSLNPEANSNVRINFYAFFVILFCTLTLTVLAWLSNGRQSLGIDDANIFINYAERFSAGEGLTYASDIPRVEGFTSFLWVILISGIIKVNGGELGILFLTIFLVCITQFVALKIVTYGKNSGTQKHAAIIYLILITSSAAYSSWMTITLMDITLYGLVVSLFIFILLNPDKNGKFRFKLALFTFLISYWIRPESSLLGLIIFFLILIRWQTRISTLKYFMIFVFFLISVSSLTLFRIFYFGEFLPNTFYAKVSPSLTYDIGVGLDYLQKYITSIFPLLILLVALVMAQFRTKQMWVMSPLKFIQNVRELRTPYVVVVFLVITVIPVLAGGDHFNYFRFFQPGFPLFCILITESMIGFLYSNKAFSGSPTKQMDSNVFDFKISSPLSFTAKLLLLITFLVSQTSQLSWWMAFKETSPIKHEFSIAAVGLDQGKKLNEMFSFFEGTRPSIGVVTAGGISRGYTGPIYDLMGLNNKQMAHFSGSRVGVKNHAAFEKSVFYEMNIDIVLASPENGFENAIFKNMFFEKEFYGDWEYGHLVREGEDTISFKAFYKKDFLSKVLRNDNFAFIPELRFSTKSLKWERF